MAAPKNILLQMIIPASTANPLLGTPDTYTTKPLGFFDKEGLTPNAILANENDTVYFPIVFKGGHQQWGDLADLGVDDIDRHVMTAPMIVIANEKFETGETVGTYALNQTKKVFMNAKDASVGDLMFHFLLVETGLLGTISDGTNEVVKPDNVTEVIESVSKYDFVPKACIDIDIFDDDTNTVKTAATILAESNVVLPPEAHLYPIKGKSETIVLLYDVGVGVVNPAFSITAIERAPTDFDPADPGYKDPRDTGVPTKDIAQQLLACCGAMLGFILLIVAAVCMTIEKAKDKGGAPNRFGVAQIIFFGLAAILVLMAMTYANFWLMTGVIVVIILQKMVAGNELAVWPTLERRI